jgi:cell division protease FtsH
VPIPDIDGREKILAVHMKKVPLAPDVNPRVIARGTPGFSGADLANLVNEAALLAARRNKRLVAMQEFEDAKDKVQDKAEDIKNKAGDKAADVKHEVKAAANQADHKANQAQHNAGKALDSAQQQANKAVDQAQHKAEEVKEQAGHQVQSKADDLKNRRS